MPEAKIILHKEQHDIPFGIIHFANFAMHQIYIHKVIVHKSCGELSIKEQCKTAHLCWMFKNNLQYDTLVR